MVANFQVWYVKYLGNILLQKLQEVVDLDCNRVHFTNWRNLHKALNDLAKRANYCKTFYGIIKVLTYFYKSISFCQTHNAPACSVLWKRHISMTVLCIFTYLIQNFFVKSNYKFHEFCEWMNAKYCFQDFCKFSVKLISRNISLVKVIS